MRIPNTRNAHLTYCLNVHAGTTLAEAETAIFEHAPRVFAELPDAEPAFGLGLWLAANAAQELAQGDRLDAFARRLRDAGLYTFTFNGFPYGAFHGTRVKEKVYRPDWSTDGRRDYTLLLADLLAQLLPEGVNGSISTLPITFRPWATDDGVDASVRNLATVAVHLAKLRAETGRDIALALEPEPGCFLEKTDDVVDFYADHLLPDGAEALVREHGIPTEDAEDLLRRHIGICLDTVHTGVMGEDPADVLRRLGWEGIRVTKVQLGAALSVPVGPDGPPAALHDFVDEVYLHQTVVRQPDGDIFFTDLPDALEAAPEGEWRVHFHVPLAWDGDGAIGTTRHQVTPEFLKAALRAGVEHFETEIYTLDVFPKATASKEAILAQDMAWVLERFTSA